MPQLLRNSFGKTAWALKNGYKLSSQDILGAGIVPAFNNMFFVHNSGSDANQGLEVSSPFATIDYAIGMCTASKGDVIVVLPGHAETVTAAITMDVIGVQLVGAGEGGLRPAVTGNFAGDAITVTAAKCLIENLHFPAPETTSQTADINVAAAGVTIRGTRHIGSKTSKIKVDSITVASGGDDLLVEGVRGFSTVETTPTSFLSLEAAVARFEMRGCYIAGEYATAPLMDEATATLALIHHNYLKNITAAKSVATFTTGNSTGIFAFNMLSGRHTTIATNLVEGTGMDFFENKVVEEAALSGLLEPAADAD